MKMNSIRLVLIILIFASLVLLEIFMFIKSQYHQGLDRNLCKCENLKNFTQKGRLANGIEVDKENLKWTALFFLDKIIDQNRTILAVCTASVLNEIFLITAAHCLADSSSDVLKLREKSDYFVGVNFGHNMTKAYSPNTPRRKIRNFFVHQDFKSKTVGHLLFARHDIGILELEESLNHELEEPLELGDDVLPACLIEHDYSKFENNFVFAGYGMEDYYEFLQFQKNPKLSILKKSLVKDKLMMGIFKESSDCEGMKVDLDFRSDKICVFRQFGDVLSGDSGGALLYPTSKSLFVAGIFSTYSYSDQDFLCENKTCKRILFRSATFTRVHSHLNWIDEIIDTNRCISSKVFRLNYIKCLLLACILLLTCFITYLLIIINREASQ